MCEYFNTLVSDHNNIVSGRPQVDPNPGFFKQLNTFADCAYEPSPTNAAYISWKQEQEQNFIISLNQIVDTTVYLRMPNFN